MRRIQLECYLCEKMFDVENDFDPEVVAKYEDEDMPWPPSVRNLKRMGKMPNGIEFLLTFSGKNNGFGALNEIRVSPVDLCPVCAEKVLNTLTELKYGE